MTKDEALKLALEALENGMKFVWSDLEREAGFVAIDAIKEALEQPAQETKIGCVQHDCDECKARLAQPAQEPVALTDDEIWKFWWNKPEVLEGEDDSMEAQFISACRKAIKAAAQRPWVGLDAEDRWEIIYATERDDRSIVMQLVEAKLKEKNT